MDLRLKSNKTKEIIFFSLFLFVLCNVMLSIWAVMASSTMIEGRSFFTLMFFLLNVILIITGISSIWHFPRYTYTLTDEGIDIHTSIIYKSDELKLDSKQEKRLGQLGTQLLTHSMSFSQKIGGLAFIFAKLKRNNFFILHTDIEYAIIQSSWHEYLTRTTSIFLIGKRGTVRLKYIDKKHINFITSYFQNNATPITISKKIYLYNPDFDTTIKASL